MAMFTNGRARNSRTPIALAHYLLKEFNNLHGACISSSCLNNNEEQAKERECSSPIKVRTEEVQMHKATFYATEITFTNEDLLLEGTPHNRLLFVEGYTRGQKLKRILVDQSSAVKIFFPSSYEGSQRLL